MNQSHPTIKSLYIFVVLLEMNSLNCSLLHFVKPLTMVKIYRTITFNCQKRDAIELFQKKSLCFKYHFNELILSRLRWKSYVSFCFLVVLFLWFQSKWQMQWRRTKKWFIKITLIYKYRINWFTYSSYFCMLLSRWYGSLWHHCHSLVNAWRCVGQENHFHLIKTHEWKC